MEWYTYVQELIGNNWKITGQLFATQYFSISETKMVSMFRQSHSHPFSGLVLRIRPETVWGQTSQPVRRIQKHIRYYRQSSNFCPGLVLYGFCLKQIRNCYQKTQKLQNKTICFLNEWIVELHNCDLRRKLLSLPNINLNVTVILIKCHFFNQITILRKLSNCSI